MILVVDDDRDIVQLLGKALEREGYSVESAFSGREAYERLKSRQCHCMLLDINMPNIDGGQFCRFVKSNTMFSDVKVVLCSGMEKDRIEEVVKEAGADGYVCKDEYLGRWVKDRLR